MPHIDSRASEGTISEGPKGACRRVLLLSLHTSPLAQAGLGDAGGMNVYVRKVAEALAAEGSQVTIVTAGAGRDVRISPRVFVHHLGHSTLAKNDLALQTGTFVRQLEQWSRGRRYDLIASHYWISGLTGLALSERWGLPLVHTMHTMAAIKNAHRAPGQTPEPAERLLAERTLSEKAHWLVTNSRSEAHSLQHYYGRSHNVAVVPPGLDRHIFRPPTSRPQEQGAGFRLLFAGRLQPLKGPDLTIRALPLLPESIPATLTVIGSPSGLEEYDLPALARSLGVDDRVRFLPAQTAETLTVHYRQADVVLMPSASESFGMVALEAQACGTPVVASAVGGLPEVVRDGHTGWLVDGHDPAVWAAALELVYRAGPGEWRRRGDCGSQHAYPYSWATTARGLSKIYCQAVAVQSPIWEQCVCMG